MLITFLGLPKSYSRKGGLTAAPVDLLSPLFEEKTHHRPDDVLCVDKGLLRLPPVTRALQVVNRVAYIPWVVEVSGVKG